jgi:hypothetical protein
MPRVCVDNKSATTTETKNYVDNTCLCWFIARLRRGWSPAGVILRPVGKAANKHKSRNKQEKIGNSRGRLQVIGRPVRAPGESARAGSRFSRIKNFIIQKRCFNAPSSTFAHLCRRGLARGSPSAPNIAAGFPGWRIDRRIGADCRLW